MFKKNPLRPPIVVDLKKVSNGYRVQSSEAVSLFQIKRVTRTMYRPDLIQASNLGLESQGLAISSTIIQPPSHVTLPAFASWFCINSIHPIEKEFFPEFFRSNKTQLGFSFSIKSEQLYRYYRNTIIGMWRENVKKYLSSAQCRRNLVGDVSSIVRIHGFLENWGLINFPSKEHSRGITIQKGEKLSCYVCEDSTCPVFRVAAVQDVLFQLCEDCFQEGLYSQQIQPHEFVQVLLKDHQDAGKKIMTVPQLTRMLQLLGTAAGPIRDRDKDAWTTVQKQFSNYSRQEILQNFLRIPLISQMNANIFQNNEDLKSQQQNPAPSVLEDFLNPLQTSIAVAYYRLCRQPTSELKTLFSSSEIQAATLAEQQSQKIDEMMKMMVEVSYSKLQNKTLFIYQYEKLIENCLESQRKIVANTLAQTLRVNMRLVQGEQGPQQLQSQ